MQRSGLPHHQVQDWGTVPLEWPVGRGVGGGLLPAPEVSSTIVPARLQKPSRLVLYPIPSHPIAPEVIELTKTQGHHLGAEEGDGSKWTLERWLPSSFDAQPCATNHGQSVPELCGQRDKELQHSNAPHQWCLTVNLTEAGLCLQTGDVPPPLLG